jgi:hypothetical protein
VNVTQFHNHDSRDGLYVDSAFTPSAAANLIRDLNFDGTIVGNVYAQPHYIEDGPCGRAMIIAMTESNNVYALDAFDGSVIWERNVGDPVEASDLICTKFNLMGITGTAVVDLASLALFLDAMITPDGGETKKHLIFSLNVDTGDINPGWPVDVEFYWAPTNWLSLDQSDADLCASVHCWWTCQVQRLPILLLRWVRTAMRTWLIATTLVVSASL